MMADAPGASASPNEPPEALEGPAISESPENAVDAVDAVEAERRTTPPTAPAQPHNPLHGVTLEAIVNALVARYGWEKLGERIPVRCFNIDPSVGSSLRFLRKTPWAREKVEVMYLAMQSSRQRANQRRR